MDAEQIKQILKVNKDVLFHRYPLVSIALFGSYADGTATEESDVDIMVEFSEPVGFEVVDLAIELEELLQKKVDLVTRKAIKPRLLPFISKQLQYV
ncbi:nucleotidyltransferase family protein [Larkinella terrae]|uniref:Nucleotidyltransferase n=1 Tax=Larkinella terrae TaxID=2025311 RepID=A0A7K0EKJ6_9BACT|nr:nucleotidyltransferase family protein [Larkinella terrae]MRS62305.1 nucleotidyltransferase [Larkinella terrae]